MPQTLKIRALEGIVALGLPHPAFTVQDAEGEIVTIEASDGGGEPIPVVRENVVFADGPSVVGPDPVLVEFLYGGQPRSLYIEQGLSDRAMTERFLAATQGALENRYSQYGYYWRVTRRLDFTATSPEGLAAVGLSGPVAFDPLDDGVARYRATDVEFEGQRLQGIIRRLIDEVTGLQARLDNLESEGGSSALTTSSNESLA